jgi:hypothetical protein
MLSSLITKRGSYAFQPSAREVRMRKKIKMEGIKWRMSEGELAGGETQRGKVSMFIPAAIWKDM